MKTRVRSFVLRDSVRRTLMVAAALQAAFGAAGVYALPTGPQVVSGSAHITSPAPAALQVVNTPGTIINWQSFSIAPSELVRFVQQSSASAVLNRVTGSQMSEIMGRLQSNGRVFLINPNGLLVGPGAVIDTASFVGSTLNMSNADFLAGRMRFEGMSGAGGVTNQGVIRAGAGGSVLLVAPQIENSGLIEAPGGEITLAAGRTVTVTPLNGSGVSFELQAPGDSVLNVGRLIADGGAIRAFAGTLRHSGEIRANAIGVDASGQIVLQSGSGGATLAAGSTTRADGVDGAAGGRIGIDAVGGRTRVEGTVSAASTSGAGGSIAVTGDTLSIAGSALIDASGGSGGGTVLAGGGWQGGDASVRNAQRTFVHDGARLSADATGRGDGGTVVVWADRDTQFLGTLSARGGAAGGNGGRGEVSGRGELVFMGRADLYAPFGRQGSLLLDPLDLFIDADGGLNPFIIDEATDFPNNAITVSPATLASISGNVTLYASRDMRFNSAVSLVQAGQGLSATAGRDLQLAAGIATSNGAVSLTAGRAISSTGAPTISAGTGSVVLTSGSQTNSGLGIGTISSAGTVTMSAPVGALSTGNITASGAVSLSGAAGLTANRINAGGAVTLNAGSGTATVNDTITAPGSVSVSGAGVYVSGVTAGALTVNAGSGTAVLASGALGSGNATLAGTNVSVGLLTTTGAVSLEATAGDIGATINNAASITATSARSLGNTAITLNSTAAASTPLNATSVTATASGCIDSCPGASVVLSSPTGVTVGTVAAIAPGSATGISESVTITSTAGSIRALSGASLVTAADVTLSTSAGSSGSIGQSALPLTVDVERTFTFRPNGDFTVQLAASGPNRLVFQPGVAAGGSSWSGSLSLPGALDIVAGATSSKVTLNTFSITSGFGAPVFGSLPEISVSVPNGDLRVNAMTVPPVAAVAISATGGMEVSSYTRANGGAASSAAFIANGGTLELGAIAGAQDVIAGSGRDGVVIDSVSTGRDVTLSSALGTVAARTSNIATEVTSTGGNITISGASIGRSTGARPLDLRAPSGQISLSALGTSAGTGWIGAGPSAAQPVNAETPSLVVYATRQFNVDTGNTVPLANLAVTASPSGVGSDGTAKVTAGGVPFTFVSDGTRLKLLNTTATDQFASGTLSLTALDGGIFVNDLDFSATNGSLVLRAPGAVTVDDDPFNLGAGALTIRADGAVTLHDIQASALTVRGTDPDAGSVAASLTMGRFTGPAGGLSDVAVQTSGAIATSHLDGVRNVSLSTASGYIATGNIGSAGSPASAVTLATNAGTISAGAVTTGTFSASSTTGAISTGAISATNATAGRVSLSTGAGVSVGGDIVAQGAGTVELRSGTSITAQKIDVAGNVVLGPQESAPTVLPTVISLGAIGAGNRPASVGISGETATFGGEIALDTAGSGRLDLYTTASTVLNSPVRGRLIFISGSGDLAFGRIEAGTGTVSIARPGAQIKQTLSAGSGGGIQAQSVSLNGGQIGSSVSGDLNRLTLRGVTDLAVRGGAMKFKLTDPAGSSPAPALTRLDIARTDNTAVFDLAGLAPQQSLAVSDSGTTTSVGFISTVTADFRYRADQSGVNLNVSGPLLSVSGATVDLSTVDGNIDVNQTLTASFVYLNAGGSGVVQLNNPVNAFGTLSVSGAGVFGSGPLVNSLNTVALTARNGGSIKEAPASSTRLQVSAPRVTLDGGELAVAMAGTSTLEVRSMPASGGPPIDLQSDTALTTVALQIGAPGVARPFSLVAPGQGFDIQLSGNGMDVRNVTSTTPLSLLSLDAGAMADLRVIGTRSSAGAPSQIAATDLSLAGYRVILDHTDPDDGVNRWVVLKQAGYQQISGIDSFAVTGRAQLEAGSYLNFAGRTGSIQPAAGGQIGITAPSVYLQSLLGGLSVRGGSGTGESVSVSASDAMSVSANDNLIIAAGGPSSGVTLGLDASATGSQKLSARNTVQITGGSGAGAPVDISFVGSGSGQQRVEGGTILLSGGSGANSSVRVGHLAAGGVQQIGRADTSQADGLPLTGNITLQGGSAGGAEVRVESDNARQWVLPTGTLTLQGGSAVNTGVAIVAGGGTAQAMVDAPQVIGYSTVFDCLGALCTRSEPVAITLRGGSASGTSAEISTTGAQRLRATGTVELRGGSGATSYALLEGAAQDVRAGSLVLAAGTGQNAFAQIAADGGSGDTPVGASALQYLWSSGSLALSGGGTAGGNTASAAVTSGWTQRIEGEAATTLAAGSGPDSDARVLAVGDQRLVLGSTTLTGGSGAHANVEIGSSLGRQDLTFGSLALTGGTAAQSSALIAAATGQTVSAGVVTLTGGTGAAGPGNDAGAGFYNTGGDQSLSATSLNVRSGANYAPAGIVNLGGNQSVISSGLIDVRTSAGANLVNDPLVGNYHAGIVQRGSGTQEVGGGTVTLDNAHSAGGVGIVNRGAGQSLYVQGQLDVLASGGTGVAAVDSSGGAQTVTANGGISVLASAGSGRAQIVGAGSSQVLSSNGGGLQVRTASASGNASIEAAGVQSITARSIEVTTHALSSGNAEVTAGGAQTLTTTNGSAAGFSLKVASLGMGSARVVAAGNQLIAADYPFMMQGTADGRIIIGHWSALGSALVSGANQDIFARSILIRGGTQTSATARLDATGTQTISILTPSSTIAAGITVAGGAGGFASLDPTVQTIVSNGPIQVQGGSGPGTYAQIDSSGPQTVLVTGPATADSVRIAGGGGDGAYAAITTTHPDMVLGTSGGITLTGGSGANADAVFGNGPSNAVAYACGAFTCSFANLTGTPLTNALTDVGVANNGVSVPLSALAPVALGGPPPPPPPPVGSSSTGGAGNPPFEFSSLLVSLRTQADGTIDVEPPAELTLSPALSARRLPLCR